MSDKDALKDAREQFDDASDAWSDARSSWLDDMKFARLGEQWPERVKIERQRESRPCLTINRLPSFIRQVVNDSRLNKPAIKVHPVDSGADPETAELLGDLVRQIEASSNAEVAYDTAIDHAVSGGFGFFRINVEYAYDDAFEQDLRIQAITNPLTVYWDASSMASDATDWRYAFVTDEIPKSVFQRQYKGAEPVDWDSEDYRQLTADWLNEDSVRVAEWWTREEVERRILKLSNGTIIAAKDYEAVIDDIPQAEILRSMGIQVVGDRITKAYKVRQRIITGAEIIKDIEWAGCFIPICPVWGEDITVDGKRHFISLTRQAKDAQQNLNYWRTAATELVALAPKAPYIGPKGAFASDRKKWESANVRSHPYIEYDGATPPQRQAFAGVPAGALQEAMNAQDDLKSIMGMFDASLGARSNETSGKAIIARQREGDVSTFHYIDNLSRGISYGGRCLVDLVPKVYNTPRMLRVIGQDQTSRMVPVNRQGAMDLTVGKYDVTVTAGPGFTSKREESANGMIEMMRVNPAVAPLIGDLVAKAADWPNADEVAKRLKAMLPPQILQAEQSNLPPEAQAVVAQQGQQMQQMQAAIQQLQAQIQQGAQAFQQLQAENQMLKIQQANKSGELQVKQQELILKDKEIDSKAATEQTKAAAGVEEERIRAMADQMVARIEAMADSVQRDISEVKGAVSSPQPQSGDSSAITAMVAQMLAQMNQPKNKVMTISAPSGATYQAVVNNGAVRVSAPSGQVYTGVIQ